MPTTARFSERTPESPPEGSANGTPVRPRGDRPGPVPVAAPPFGTKPPGCFGPGADSLPCPLPGSSSKTQVSARQPLPFSAPNSQALPLPRFLPVRGPRIALALGPTLVYAVAVPFATDQSRPFLATRDGIMAPEDESPQAPPTDNGEPNLDTNVNKTEATIRLIAEWNQAGKPTRSNVDLVEELNRRYPRAGFTAANVAQAKQRLKTHDAAARLPGQGPPSSDPAAALPGIAPEETDFVRQLRQLVNLLGREAVKRLIDSL
jgi:hypothetical protein